MILATVNTGRGTPSFGDIYINSKDMMAQAQKHAITISKCNPVYKKLLQKRVIKPPKAIYTKTLDGLANNIAKATAINAANIPSIKAVFKAIIKFTMVMLLLLVK